MAMVGAVRAMLLPAARRRGLGLRAAVDDLVELAAIEPHAAAARAVVDLHAVALRHHQRLVVDRTFHAASSSVPCSGWVEYGGAALQRNPPGRVGLPASPAGQRQSLAPAPPRPKLPHQRRRRTAALPAKASRTVQEEHPTTPAP